MSKGKWKDTIPFNEDDLKIYEALSLAEEIEKCYQDYNVQIKIQKKGYNPCYGDGFRFIAKLKGKTHIEEIDKLTQTMKVRLKQPGFHIFEEDGILYIATFSSAVHLQNNDLKQILSSDEYKSNLHTMELAHPVGINEAGEPMICDLIDYPHAMICGTSLSGKSTAIRCLLTSLANYSPKHVNFLIADRGNGLSAFKDLPHCSCPIIHEPDELTNALLLLEEESNRRTKIEISDHDTFERLSFIVCVIDEFSWFINNTSCTEEAVRAINSLLEYGRHNKIHLILSIHDPKKDIMKIEKTNLRVRLAFETVNSRKSSTILGDVGAEKLQGRGEMIFHHENNNYRLLGFNIDDEEIASEIQIHEWQSSEANDSYSYQDYGFFISAEEWKKVKTGFPEYNTVSSKENAGTCKSKKDVKFANVVLWVLSRESVSINLIQTELHIANRHADDFFKQLQSYGVIGD